MMKLFLLGEIAISLLFGIGTVYWVWRIRKTRILWDIAWKRINIGVFILSLKWIFAGLAVFFVEVIVTWFGIIYEGLTLITAIYFLLGFRKLYHDLVNPYANLFARKKIIAEEIKKENGII